MNMTPKFGALIFAAASVIFVAGFTTSVSAQASATAIPSGGIISEGILSGETAATADTSTARPTAIPPGGIISAGMIVSAEPAAITAPQQTATPTTAPAPAPTATAMPPRESGEKKPFPLKLTLQISAGAAAAIGIIGGITYNGMANDQYIKYKIENNERKVLGMGNKLDNYISTRNLLYVIGGIGLCGLTVTFFF